MKKMLIACSAVICLFSFSAAFAEDAADIYKTRCQSCHGADGTRVRAPGDTPVKGLSPTDLLNALKGYKTGTFGGERKQVMQNIAKQLSDDQMKSLADYIPTL